MAREKDIKDAQEKKEKMKRPDHGIEWDRSCTDIICFVLFIAFIVVMFGCASYGFGAGDPYKLVTPFDDQGRECGKHNDVKDYKFKLPYNIYEANNPAKLYKAVCVKSCPKQGASSDCVRTKNTE